MIQKVRYNRTMIKSPVKFECSIFIVTVIVLSLIFSNLNDTNMSAAASKNGSQFPNNTKSATTEVKYELVENIPNKHLRFAAYCRNRDDDDDNDGRHKHPRDEWKPLSVWHWAQLLGGSAADTDTARRLADELTLTIVEACPSYHAFFLETKGVSYENAAEKQFEFVLVESDAFEGAEANPNPNAFREHLSCGAALNEITACSFWNLGRSAKLVSPRQRDGTPLKTYSHLAPFLRGASKDERVQLWGLVTGEYLKIIEEWGSSPVWLSTSGLGVSWLHVRLDRKPKYYTFREFANEH